MLTLLSPSVACKDNNLNNNTSTVRLIDLIEPLLFIHYLIMSLCHGPVMIVFIYLLFFILNQQQTQQLKQQLKRCNVCIF